jgi:hypothetical protein
MKAKDLLRQSLELTPAEWEALEKLANETQSHSARGPTAKQPSWRILIKRIANGELQIVNRPE